MLRFLLALAVAVVAIQCLGCASHAQHVESIEAFVDGNGAVAQKNTQWSVLTARIEQFLEFSLGENVEDKELRPVPSAKREQYLHVLRSLFVNASLWLPDDPSSCSGLRPHSLLPLMLSHFNARAQGDFLNNHSCDQHSDVESFAIGPTVGRLLANESVADRIAAVAEFLCLVSRQRNQTAQATHRPNNTAVLIIGGGPSGLVSAVTTRLMCSECDVVVVEKREQYTRNIWFDLYGKPWYQSVDVLTSLGLLKQAYQIEVSTGENNTIVSMTMRAAALEHFLMKVAAILGSQIHFQSEFLGLCYSPSSGALHWNAVLATAGNAINLNSNVRAEKQALRKLLLSQPVPCSADDLASSTSRGLRLNYSGFDVVVGADGGKSLVRRNLGIGISKHSSYSWKVDMDSSPRQTGTITKSGIRQVSILMNFKPTDHHSESNGCPVLRQTETGIPLDPWGIGFHPKVGTNAVPLNGPISQRKVDGVYAVFKRFYYSTCQLQVLFLHEQGERILNTYQTPHNTSTGHSNAIPWDLLLRVTNELLAEPKESVEELQESLVPYSTAKPYASQHSHSSTSELDNDNYEHAGHSLVRVIDIQLQSADMISGTLRSAPRLQTVASIISSQRQQKYFLIGDSAFLAHYRLGVGCNAMFTVANLFKSLLQTQHTAEVSTMTPQSVIQWDEYANVVKLNSAALSLVRSFVEFQLSTMFFESFCDFIVFFNSDPSRGDIELFRSQVLYLRDPEYNDYVEPRWSRSWTGGLSPYPGNSSANGGFQSQMNRMCSK